MKNIAYDFILVIKSIFACLVLVFVLSSCNSDTDDSLDGNTVYDWSVEQGNKNPVIDKKIGDIKFKFCLLNKDSVPATAFKQGENIYFYFDIKNIAKELITINELEVLSEDDVFMVYSAETNAQVGKPWYTKGCLLIMPNPRFDIPVNDSRLTILPWSYIWDKLTVICPKYRFCCQEQEYLPPGEYFCRFKTNFIYKKNGEEKKINDLSFTINFKVI